jgi:hypothetical protein
MWRAALHPGNNSCHRDIIARPGAVVVEDSKKIDRSMTEEAKVTHMVF